MNRIVITLAGALMITAFLPGPAAAWSHANRWGGDTSHDYGSGSTTRTDAWGGSETHTYGEGTTATGRYGDTATHEQGSGQTSFTNPYGGSATHTYGYGTTATSASGATAYRSPYYGGGYYPYHPPATVNYYGSSCGNCGAWPAGAAAAGAAVGMAAGMAAGAASAEYAMGSTYATLPAGCFSPGGRGVYYQCGSAWLQPVYGANGVYYRVVPAPY
jgi:hypothetical protein